MEMALSTAPASHLFPPRGVMDLCLPAEPTMLLGLTGERGAGKSTAGDLLVQRHAFKAFAFADPIKDLTRRVFGLSRDELWGASATRERPLERAEEDRFWTMALDAARHDCHAELAELFPLRHPTSQAVSLQALVGALEAYRGKFTPRVALQQVGGWGMLRFTRVWIDATMRAVKRSGATRAVVTDVRTVVEAREIHNGGGRLARIDASRRAPPRADRPGADHPTETAARDIRAAVDIDVDNNSTLENFAGSVARLVRWMREHG